MRFAWVCLFLLSACSPSSEYFGRTTPKHGADEVWLNNVSEPETLDPGKCSDNTGGEILTNLFAGLVQAHPETLQPIPDMAEKWTVSPDGKTYTFFLRKSVWSDGTPLTAHDFEKSWKRVLSPETGSKNASQFFILKNGEAFLKKKVDKAKVGVRALDDQRLEVQLENAIPYFLNLLSYYSFFPIPLHVLERLKKEGKNPDLWTRSENMVSNGAFVLSEWKFRQNLVVTKNPKYWDAEKIKIKKVRVAMVEGANTAMNMYRTADFDFSGKTSLPLEMMSTLTKYKDFYRAPYLGVYYYWINTKSPYLSNVHFRKALRLAIDRNAIVQYITRGGQVPTADFVPDGLAGYKGLKSSTYDLEKAKEELKKSGFQSGQVPKISLLYNTLQGHKMIAEAVHQMWKKGLGIEVELENQEYKVFLERQRQMDFGLSRDAWLGDYPDPFTFLEILSSGSGNNHSNWKSSEYDELLKKANQTVNQHERLKILRKAEEIIYENAPIIPIYVWTRNYLKKPYLKGLWSNYQDRHPWKFFYIE